MNSGVKPDAGWSGKGLRLSSPGCTNRLWKDKEWQALLTFQRISIGIAHILYVLVLSIVR